MSEKNLSNADYNARKFGIDLVGDIHWGTHLCQFYDTKQDLIDILVPYFVEGLRSNDFCMWVTSPPLEVDEAKKALEKAVPNLEEYIGKKQIEIISYNDWYLLGGKFDSNRVLQGWVEKEQGALENGFKGLRLTGNTFWIERPLWQSFVDYEEAVNAVIGEHKMLALCTYCLGNCSGTDVLDVVRNHVGTLVKQTGRWYLVEDAARRKAVNGALKLSERKYSALFENMQDAFAYHKLLVDEAGRPVDYVFLEVNSDFERFTGLKRANVIGRRVTEIIPDIQKDPANWIGVYGKVALTGEQTRFENYSQALGRWYQVSAYSPQKGYFVATFEDITDRKKAEESVRFNRDVAQRRAEELERLQIKLEEKAAEVKEYANQMEQIANERLGKLKDAERLAAIGATAGMVGHDIRNPLQAITSDAFLAKAELVATPDSEQKKMALESLEEIEKNVEYINKIVQDLQDYARPLNPKIEESDVQQTIEKIISKIVLPKNIKVNIEIDETTRKIKADSYYLHRILYNLVTNSVQAMPRGGKLSIQLRREADDIVLAVSDTGVGIPENIQDKMFTLMFTTKSKGQGFGLPVVKRMTESLRGTVSFNSQEGKGTTFTVRLPSSMS